MVHPDTRLQFISGEIGHGDVLEDGRVAESGSHELLLAAGGVYARLCRKRQEEGVVRERLDGRSAEPSARPIQSDLGLRVRT